MSFYKQSWNVWQKYQMHHKPAFTGFSLVEFFFFFCLPFIKSICNVNNNIFKKSHTKSVQLHLELEEFKIQSKTNT